VGSKAELHVLKNMALHFLRAWKTIKKREQFFTDKRGKVWLEKELPVSASVHRPRPAPGPIIPGSKGDNGLEFKPRKPFENLSQRGKRGRMSSILKRKPDEAELEFLLERKISRPSTPNQRKKDNDNLLLFSDVNSGKSSYMKASKRQNWPSYYQIQKAKKNVLYPRDICYGESRVEVSLSELMTHSCSRILEFLMEEKCIVDITETEKVNLELWCKVGGDGQGDHSEYSQKNSANESGASVYCISYVPLQLKAKGRLLWRNMEPNSPNICQPLLFSFAKENDEFIQCEEGKLKEQIENLPDIHFTVGNEEFLLKNSSVKVYSTMWDGKSCTAIAKNFLENGKKLASNTCHLCLATPTVMNKQDVWDRPILLTQMVEYSCTVLHMWIRAMEYLFNLATKLPQENRNKPLTSKECQLTKLEMKAKFWHRLSIKLFEVKHGHGSTNTGNTARNFFKKDPNMTASILKIDPKIVVLLGELLDMFNDPLAKPSSNMFHTKAREVFCLLTTPSLDIYPMSQSVHRFLVHGHVFIEEFELPIGALSESALEARNKINRGAREHHARKTSMKDNVADIFNHLLFTSDPYLFLRKQTKISSKP